VELVLYPAGVTHTDYNRRILTKQVLVELESGHDAQPSRMLWRGGWSPAPAAEGYFIFVTTETGGALGLAEAVARAGGVNVAEPMLRSWPGNG